jgi:hypothetical protein
LTNAQASEQNKSPVFPRKTLENGSLYCTFTALLRKSLIIHGAGEGDRTLVTSMVVENGGKWFLVVKSGQKWFKMRFFLEGC